MELATHPRGATAERSGGHDRSGAEASDRRWLSIVGIGESGVSGLSPAASQLIAESPFVIGGKRHLDLAAPLIRGESLAWKSPIEDTFPAVLARRGQPTCILATGDPFHYGVGATLSRFVAAAEIRCLPQPSAFSLAAAGLGWALQDCTCLSLHGRTLDRFIPHLQAGARVLALSWDRSTPEKLAALLRERGFGPSSITVCEAIGGPAERFRTTLAANFDLAGIADLNTMAVELRAEHDGQARSFASGLPDDSFEHDGQITKAPVRAVTLSALAPRFGETLWDIGAGSGSITVEWLLAHPSTFAVAVEKNPGRGERVMRNARTWNVDHRLTPVIGLAPDCLVGLPQPNAIFIGGGISVPGLLDDCYAVLLTGGRLVANAVTLEGQALLATAMARLGGDLMTLSVATAEAIGAFHGFRPAMPVMQWRWTKP